RAAAGGLAPLRRQRRRRRCDRAHPRRRQYGGPGPAAWAPGGRLRCPRGPAPDCSSRHRAAAGDHTLPDRRRRLAPLRRRGGPAARGARGMSGPDPETLRRWDLAHLWHPFTQMAEYGADEPLVVVAAEGHELIDDRGRRYFDATSALWCNLFGHRVPEIDAAICAQLERVAHSTLLGATHPPAAELARRLVERAPPGLSHVFFSDDGAT